MHVSLTPHLEELVRDKVKSGLYNSASEVVREALRLMEDRDRVREMRLEDLRKEIQIGIDQLERGESTEYTTETLHELFDDYQGQRQGKARGAAPEGRLMARLGGLGRSIREQVVPEIIDKVSGLKTQTYLF